ncbi:hypothetical protein B566_EDAN009195 [Ephemera danica]|nr:hypothetical protein B566_EDAN009195 [Ephemera danica]
MVTMSRSTSGKSTSHKKKEEKERKSSESRKYAQIQSDSIVLYSDSIVDKIGDDIVRPLAEDVSYRLRELIHVLHTKEIPPVYGHAGKGQIRFTYIDEANIFVEDDPEIDIIQLAISNIGITQKGKHFIKNFHSNVKFGPVVPHIIEALIQALEEADKVGERRFWLLDAIDALADNEAVDLSPLLCVNSLVTCLIHCALDFHATDRGFSFSVDEDFRLKTALILSKVLQRWSGAVIVREVLLRLSSILKDLRIPLPVHRGALHVLTAMGQAPLALCLWPLLLPSEKYAYFLNTIQSVEEVIIDFEAIKNIILCGAETLLPKEPGQSDEEKGEVPCIINPTSAELEQEDLARKVQPVLYDIFGDAVTIDISDELAGG